MFVLPPDYQGSRKLSAPAANCSYFPPPRAELTGTLAEADEILNASMAGTGKMIPAGHVFVREGEAHTTICRLTRGKVARIRTLEDGRKNA
jgi:hypothetical protein